MNAQTFQKPTTWQVPLTAGQHPILAAGSNNARYGGILLSLGD